jgi:hypothetical protein
VRVIVKYFTCLTSFLQRRLICSAFLSLSFQDREHGALACQDSRRGGKSEAVRWS